VADEILQALNVSIHSKVIEVPANAPRERGVLFGNRKVSMAATPLVDRTNCLPETSTPCLERHLPTPPPSPTPVQREPEEVEGPGTFPVLATLRRSAEGDQAGFLRMQSQSKAPVVRENRIPLDIIDVFVLC